MIYNENQGVNGIFPQCDKDLWEFLLPALPQWWEVKARKKTATRWWKQMSSLRTGPITENALVFDRRLERLYRQTAAVVFIRHIHPVHPFVVVRACSQHLYQITLMHRKNLFFCSSAPDGPFYSAWVWSINPFVVMSLHFNKTAPFRSPVHLKRFRTWIRTGIEVL